MTRDEAKVIKALVAKSPLPSDDDIEDLLDHLPFQSEWRDAFAENPLAVIAVLVSDE